MSGRARLHTTHIIQHIAWLFDTFAPQQFPMPGKRIIFYILAAFIAGNFLLIYIQYNSAKNINALIDGNEQLLRELKAASNLKELEKDIITVESRIHANVSAPGDGSIVELERKIEEVETDIRQVQEISGNDSSVRYIQLLDRLVHEKMNFSKQALALYQGPGKNAGLKASLLEKEKPVTDSLLNTIHTIESIRQHLLAEVTFSADDNGKKALRFGTILIAFVLISGAVLFWVIINTIRTQDSLIKQLNISERKVKEAAAIKEKFMANMSHEIRTPLNAILGFTSLLQKKTLDAEAAQHVQTIHQSGENLLSIVNDILDLSKIEAGMMRIESVPFSIGSIMQATETMFRAKAAEKELQLSFYTDETLPAAVEGDPVRLTQVLVNLVGNALKFTNSGSVTVTVKNEGMENDKVIACITIRDTGIGIEKEKLDLVFERFRQAEDAVNRSYGGTGLGLSIVKELVQLQGGTIAAESTPGKGTEFRLTIPYTIAGTINKPALHIPRKINATTGAAHILVAEDNEVNQLLIKHLLTSWQFTFDIVQNGREALDQLKSKQYDLILMDIQMPEMDGYAATQQIRQQLKLTTPIIAMTAHAFAGEKEKCLNHGMNEYISKPISEQLLHELITQYIKKKEQWQYIDLRYMKEVSGGDIAYERTVTQQFMEILPVELLALEEAWKNGDAAGLQKTAHSMKTTISVMGLNGKLQPYLDAFEYDELDNERFQKNYSGLCTIAHAALEEAKQFYSGL